MKMDQIYIYICEYVNSCWASTCVGGCNDILNPIYIFVYKRAQLADWLYSFSGVFINKEQAVARARVLPGRGFDASVMSTGSI